MSREFIVPQSNAGGYENDGDLQEILKNIIEGSYAGATGILTGDKIYADSKDIPAIQARLDALGKTGVNVLPREQLARGQRSVPNAPEFLL